MEKNNISVHCLQFGVQAMDNKGEDAGKICFTSKKKRQKAKNRNKKDKIPHAYLSKTEYLGVFNV